MGSKTGIYYMGIDRRNERQNVLRNSLQLRVVLGMLAKLLCKIYIFGQFLNILRLISGKVLVLRQPNRQTER